MFVKVKEHSFCKEPAEDSDEPYSYQGASGIEVEIQSLHLENPEYFHIVNNNTNIFCEEIRDARYYGEDKFQHEDTAFLVLVKYEDGDTFGSSEYWTIVAALKDQERAKEIAREIELRDEAKSSFNSNKTAAPESTATVTYLPWDHYFGHLCYVEILEMKVLK